VKRFTFVIITILLSGLLVAGLLSVAFLIELRFRASHSDPVIEWLDQRQVVMRPYGLWTHPTMVAGSNAEGFRFHREISKGKPPGTIRIAVLGGSAVWGTGIGVNQTLAVHLESELMQRGLSQVEVLNFGMGGFDSTTELIQLSLKVLPYRPDFVVIFDGWNDVAARRYVPHLNDITAKYKNVLDQANLGVSGLRQSIKNAFLSTYTGRPFAYLFRYGADVEQRDRYVRETAERYMSRPVLRPPEERDSAVYASNLKSIAGVLRAHGIGALFAYQPYNETDFERDGWQSHREPYLEFERAFYESCGATGSRCYSFDGAIKGPEAPSNSFIDIVHLSDFGNRVIGSVLAALLAPELQNGAPAALPAAGWIQLNETPVPSALDFPFTVKPLPPPPLVQTVDVDATIAADPASPVMGSNEFESHREIPLVSPTNPANPLVD
jgi:lysophospholipase L1-like esterase